MAGKRMLRIFGVVLGVWGGLASSVAQAGPALLFDAANGRILYAEDLDNQWHPASLTKIMTAYVVFEAIKEGKISLETRIRCSELAHVQPPSKIGLNVGAEMSVQKGLEALIIKSANDVAVMLAEAVAGSQEAFVERMNGVAQRLGMTRTKFVNANGLPEPEQVTTARDLARLASAVFKDFPEYAHMWAMTETRVGKAQLRTHNGLLNNYAGADGMKTGFICDSGYNVVASATRDGHKLVAVVLGEVTGNDRALRAASLLEHGFMTYNWKLAFPGQTIATMPLEPDAKGPITIRESVISWVCGKSQKAMAKMRKRRAEKIAETNAYKKVVPRAKSAKAAAPAEGSKE
ncbi:MAG: D-alanyl-D-alanine carboxypeptidase family protein [Hyphomicrobiaceae bacterium]|nr:D-alanyl-D-alanine carboxypeptidase family protein [Hyphomicrobiaceae bacterium]